MPKPKRKITTHDFLKYVQLFINNFDKQKADQATTLSLNILSHIAIDLASRSEPLSVAFASKAYQAKDRNDNVLNVLFSDSIYLTFFETYPELLKSITKEALNYCFKTVKGNTVSPLLNLFREDKDGLTFIFKFKNIFLPLLDVTKFNHVKIMDNDGIESCYDFIRHLAEYEDGLLWLIENHFKLAICKPNVLFKVLNSNYRALVHGESLASVKTREGVFAQHLNVKPEPVSPQITYKQFKTDLLNNKPDIVAGLHLLLSASSDSTKSKDYIQKELLEIYNDIKQYSDKGVSFDDLSLEEALAKSYATDGNGTMESVLIKNSNLGGCLFLAAYPQYFKYLTRENLNFYSMVVWQNDEDKILIESPLSRIIMLGPLGVQFLINHDLVKYLDVSLLTTPGYYLEGQLLTDKPIQRIILELMKYPETVQWLISQKNHPTLKSQQFILTLISKPEYHQYISDFALDQKTFSECVLPKYIKDECQLTLNGSILSFHFNDLEKKYPNVVKTILYSFNKKNNTKLDYRRDVIVGNVKQVYDFICEVNTKIEELKVLAQFDETVKPLVKPTVTKKSTNKNKKTKKMKKKKAQQPLSHLQPETQQADDQLPDIELDLSQPQAVELDIPSEVPIAIKSTLVEGYPLPPQAQDADDLTVESDLSQPQSVEIASEVIAQFDQASKPPVKQTAQKKGKKKNKRTNKKKEKKAQQTISHLHPEAQQADDQLPVSKLDLTQPQAVELDIPSEVAISIKSTFVKRYPFTPQANHAYNYLSKEFSLFEFHLVGSQVAEAYLRAKSLPSIQPNDVDFVTTAQIGQILRDHHFRHSPHNGHDLYSKNVDGVHIEIKILPLNTNIDDYLLQRDLSIAALRANKNGEIFDPCGRGLTDLKERLLHMINEAEAYFKHSPTSITRIAKFKMINFNLEPGLLKKILAWERNINHLGWLNDHIGKRIRAFNVLANKTNDWRSLREQEREWIEILSHFGLLQKVYDADSFSPYKTIEELRIILKKQLGLYGPLDSISDEQFITIKYQQKAQAFTRFFAQQQWPMPTPIIQHHPYPHIEFDKNGQPWMVGWQPPAPLSNMRTVEEIEANLTSDQFRKC